MEIQSETCLVVKTNELFNDAQPAFQGFTQHITLPQLHHQPRHLMEDDPSYKQLVSYVVCESPNGEILMYKRLKGSGEQRLHHKLSIGVGGHMNPIPNSQNELYDNAIRELQEEIGTTTSIEHIGYINDDSNDVGKVHLGVVYKAIIDPENVKVIECDTLKVEWLDKDHLPVDQLENWSKLIINHI